MHIKKISSLSEITPDACLQTNGSKPLRVLCDDYNQYICKYNKGRGFPFSLFNEYIASCFLKIWKIQAPDFAFVNIEKDHVKQTGLRFYYFDSLCYGSQINPDYKDVDMFFVEMSMHNSSYDSLRESLLKIAIFDIWLSNEDRSEHNYNLLFDFRKKILIPIDHSDIFNGNNIDKELVQIAEEESILTSMLFKRTFSRILPKNIRQLRLKIAEEFKSYVAQCQKKLPEILQATPNEWLPDRTFLSQRLSRLFSDDWISLCIKSFNYYLQISKNHIK